MKAIVVKEFGGPDVMKLEEVRDPTPAPGQLLIRVQAVGVNPVETYIRAGAYARKPNLPYSPGTDVGGTVHAIGASVTRVKVGDRVYGIGAIGGYGEIALCEDWQVYRLPQQSSFAQGSAIGVPYATAWRGLLMRAQARPGESVLVHGASGGVGTAAVQIARAFGMRVIVPQVARKAWRSFAVWAHTTCSIIARPTTCSASPPLPAGQALTSSSRCSPT